MKCKTIKKRLVLISGIPWVKEKKTALKRRNSGLKKQWLITLKSDKKEIIFMKVRKPKTG